MHQSLLLEAWNVVPFIFMTSTVSHGLGGTNILAVPSFLRVLFLTGCRVVGIKQFDTAKYYGASEATLASLNLRKIKVTSKWGVSLETDPKNPAAARWMGEFSADRLRSEVQSSTDMFHASVDLGFALHRPKDNFVDKHIEVLMRCKADGLVNRIGYSCDNADEVLQDSSWCDFVIMHHSLVDFFSKFQGQILVHGAFRAGLNHLELADVVLALPQSNEVTFLLGTRRPWRLLLGIRNVRAAATSFKSPS
jgi:hypothetical protein